MKFYVLRQIYRMDSTLGLFIANDRVLCYVLEDVVRHSGAAKVPGKTAIPAGCYETKITFSNHFGRTTAELFSVPGFNGIRIHGGNTVADTEGCLLVAYNKVNDWTIQGSAEKDISALIAKQKENCFIEVVNTVPGFGL